MVACLKWCLSENRDQIVDRIFDAVQSLGRPGFLDDCLDGINAALAEEDASCDLEKGLHEVILLSADLR